MMTSFNGGRSRSTQREPLTMGRQLVNFITCGCNYNLRVLEQSLIEIKAGTKRKRGDIWFVDPLNPYERKRQEECPVGLKNVGVLMVEEAGVPRENH
jgi:hypothetical protein